MKTLEAYKNDPELKRNFLKEVEKHRKADQIEQGTYGHQNGTWKGCAVACSLRSLAIINGETLHTQYDEHKEYETKLGIPEWLARLEDTIFEGLSKDEAKEWPTAFAKAINVGANLEPVKWKFSAYLMKENIDRVLKLDIDENLKEMVVKAITEILSVHNKAIETGIWDKSAAESAASAAASAARSVEWAAAWAARSVEWAARSAAESAAEWAAEWAAESAEWAAESAAWAARSAAESAYTRHSKELIRLLKATK